MPSWIYSKVLQAPEDKKPAFVLQSTLNWAHALAFEILSEHGPDPASWVGSFNKGISSTVSAPPNPTPLLESVEPLISSISFALSLSLRSIESPSATAAWLRPAAVVVWYYALYGAVRSMLASVAQPSADDHRKTMRAYLGSLACRLPHPFNMRAKWVANEDYQADLPSITNPSHFNLTKSFPGTRAAAQGMLLQYLVGTAGHCADRTKKQLSSQFPGGFKSAAARAARDARLEKELGLMHCAFRYRGKANYRDALYLSYGQQSPAVAARFVEDLRVSAQAFAVLALIVIRRTRGQQVATDLCSDLSVSLRDVAALAPGERFWEAVP